MPMLRALFLSALVLVACTSTPDRDSDDESTCGSCASGQRCNGNTGKCEAVKDGGTDTDGGTSDGGSSDCEFDTECPEGRICSDSVCVPGCTAQHACGGSLECCGGTCVDVSSDSNHCGSCEAPACEANQTCAQGVCTNGSNDKTLGVASLFEVKGSVQSQFGTVKVTLLAPIVSFQKENVTHDFDGRADGLGCVADHFNVNNDPPPPEGDAGTITITGYAGGSLLPSGTAGSTMVCTRNNGTYSCAYQGGGTVATQPFGESASPLGTGKINFKGSGGTSFGSFDLQHSSTGTLTTSENLSSISYSAAQDKTITYTCTNCSDSLISVTLIATQNNVQNPSGASDTSGIVSCVFAGGSSFTIPKAAIAAMVGNDSALKSVATTIARMNKTFTTDGDGQGQTIAVNTGRGVFGIAPR
jgi:hypothetical protein